MDFYKNVRIRLQQVCLPMWYLAVAQTAEKRGVSLQCIQILRGEGRILDVMRLGHKELVAWVDGLKL